MGRFFGWGFVCVVVLYLMVAPSKAETRLMWQNKSCISYQCVVDFLNLLPAERAAEAKVVAFDDKRTYLGQAYSVLYRQ